LKLNVKTLMKLFIAFFMAGQCVARSAYAADPIKIGFILSTLQEERYLKDQRYFLDEARKLGFEAVVVSADNNPQTQTAKVENLLARGVKALVIQPVNSEAAANLVKLAHEDKVPVVAYDRMISNAPVDFYVTQDSYKVGVLQAEAAALATKGEGNYVILMGQAGHSVANEITRGNLDVLKKYPKIKVIVQKNHENWSPALALATVENALSQNKNNIQAILANNSGMANAAVQAANEQKLTGKVFIAGADADLSAIKNIVAGKLQLDILKDIEPLARTSAQVAWQLTNKTTPKSTGTVTSGTFKVPSISTPVYAIDLSQLENKIFKTGFHSKEAVYGK
jgi:D-xylose transport system substrate-binding protein